VPDAVAAVVTASACSAAGTAAVTVAALMAWHSWATSSAHAPRHPPISILISITFVADTPTDRTLRLVPTGILACRSMHRTLRRSESISDGEAGDARPVWPSVGMATIAPAAGETDAAHFAPQFVSG